VRDVNGAKPRVKQSQQTEFLTFSEFQHNFSFYSSSKMDVIYRCL
jgi:hypothetical protein